MPYKKKDIDIHLIQVNMKRAFVSSVILSILVPVLWAISDFLGLYNQYVSIINIVYAVLETVQIIFVVSIWIALRKCSHNIYIVLYTVYYALTIGLLMVAAACDIGAGGSETLYVLVCGYFIFVPILSEKMRICFMAGMTLIMITLLMLVHMTNRCIGDVLIVQLVTVIASGYQSRLTVKMHRTIQNLKKKTISSEQDALTGLLNRRGLERRAEIIWPYCKRNRLTLGIITLDIDYFKKYNDKFGHPKGDECLRIVSETLKESVHRSTDIVTRTGGEEFIIFVQGMTGKEIVSLALKIRKNVDKKAIPHAFCGVSQNVTLSMDVAVKTPEDGDTFQSLYEEADRALYLAKDNGRNCIVYDSNLYGRIRNGIAQVISM